jgi:hypothetical protein
VDQNRGGRPWRLRGAAFNRGCAPPKPAKRLALSRTTSAFNPSHAIAVRSIGPTSWAVFASKSSSILIVVRMLRLLASASDSSAVEASVSVEEAPGLHPAHTFLAADAGHKQRRTTSVGWLTDTPSARWRLSTDS